MGVFKRELSQEFIDALNELYKDQNSFWHKMVIDPELFIAFRYNYISIYLNGQSISELSFPNKRIRGKIHKKYLGINEETYAYTEGEKILEEDSRIKSLADLAQIKENIKKHFGAEKVNSYNEILNGDNNILDVEAVFVNNRIPNPIAHKDYEQSKIDYVGLEYNQTNDLKLVFYEAKLFGNPEIRSTTRPKVLDQILRYERTIEQHRDEIVIAYDNVRQYLNELHISDNGNFRDNKMLSENISIDFKPRLIIFGIDRNKDSDMHIQNLKKELGDKRVILKHQKKPYD